MSEWRQIWAMAIKANKNLIKSKEKGAVEFTKLLKKYPNDGMIYYSRGEGYEFLKEYDLAMADYDQAENNFPAPHWKKVAKYAHIRVEKSKETKMEHINGSNWWDFLHRVYGVINIPYKIRVDTLSAIERFDSEPHMSAGLLRMSLEELVNYLMEKNLTPKNENEELENKINKLEASGVISSVIASKMQFVRDKGNKGIHPEKDFRGINFSKILDNFVEIIEGLGTK